MKQGIVFLIVTCLCVCSFGAVSFNNAALNNYDDDPNLYKAMEYDFQMTLDEYLDRADYLKAEEYYLKYLDREDLPNFQRARVYCQLGHVCAGEKAIKYLEKALELEPERIDTRMVGARVRLASLYGQVFKGQYLPKNLEFYEWVCLLNEDRIKGNLLPLTPDPNFLVSSREKSLYNYIPNVKMSTTINIIAAVSGYVQKEELLRDIIERFPGTGLSAVAEAKLANPRITTGEMLDLLKNQSEGKEVNLDDVGAEIEQDETKGDIKEVNEAVCIVDTMTQQRVDAGAFWEKPFFYVPAVAAALCGLALIIFYVRKI